MCQTCGLKTQTISASSNDSIGKDKPTLPKETKSKLQKVIHINSKQ